MVHYFDKNHGKVYKYIVKAIIITGLRYKYLKDFFKWKFNKNKSFLNNSKIYKDTIKMVSTK